MSLLGGTSLCDTCGQINECRCADAELARLQTEIRNLIEERNRLREPRPLELQLALDDIRELRAEQDALRAEVERLTRIERRLTNQRWLIGIVRNALSRAIKEHGPITAANLISAEKRLHGDIVGQIVRGDAPAHDCERALAPFVAVARAAQRVTQGHRSECFASADPCAELADALAHPAVQAALTKETP